MKIIRHGVRAVGIDDASQHAAVNGLAQVLNVSSQT